MRGLLREPLLHFVLLGAAIFIAYAALGRGGESDAAPKQIQLTLDDLRQLSLTFESQWRRAPTPEEFGSLVEGRVREEILYREALALDLDQDDTIIRRRLAQKMQFLAEDVASAHEPSREELESWYADHTELFALPSRITFRQIYFSPEGGSEAARIRAEQALASLAGQPVDTDLAATLGDSIMLQEYFGDRPSEQLAKDFGPAFAVAAFDVEPGAWQGPLESGYGWHLVFVDSIVPGRSPDFAEVEHGVKTAWLGAQKERAWREAYEAMRAEYTVLLPGPPEGQTGSERAVPNAAVTQ